MARKQAPPEIEKAAAQKETDTSFDPYQDDAHDASTDVLSEQSASRFDVRKHLIRVQGGREYLPVASRLVWFREEHPDWLIVTSPFEINTEKQYAIFKAEICNEEGTIIATGYKMENRAGFKDWLEKSETGAIGRALAVCGYGTQFAPELEEGERLVDSPQTSTTVTDEDPFT